MRMRIYVIGLVFFLLCAAFLAAEKPAIRAYIEPETLAPRETAFVLLKFTFPKGMHQTLNKDYFGFSVDPIEGVAIGPVEYPRGTEENGIVNYYGSVTLKAKLTADANARPGVRKFSITASYQLCDDAGTCFFPEKVQVSAQLRIEGGTGNAATTIRYLLMALIGGLLLNFMPCVLPLLSVRALSLVQMSRENRKSIFVGSIFYTTGIVVSFLILAGLVVAVKLSGEQVGWGFQFQNPVFVLILVAAIFAFSLSMFDVYVISLPGGNLAAKASGKKGHAGSFFAGVFAVLVATPCTAPFLGPALGFAFTQPPLMIFSIFILVALGLAFPFILLGIWPGFIRRIPKPGPWMTVFKELMGFLLIGTTLYLLNTLYHQIGMQNFMRVLVFLLFLGFSCWLYGKFSRVGSKPGLQWIGLGVALGIVVASAFFTLRFEAQDNLRQTIVQGENRWEPFSKKRLENYRAEGKPVFLDFYAEWCTNCKVNEASVLNTQEIATAFDRYGVKLLKGDFTMYDEEIAAHIAELGKGGVPVYALYAPGKDRPIVFPELITKAMITNTLNTELGTGN